MLQKFSRKNFVYIAVLMFGLSLSACSFANPNKRQLERLNDAISNNYFQTADKLITQLEKSQNADTIKQLEKAKEKLNAKKAKQAELEEAVRKEMEREQAEYKAFEQDFNTVASQNSTYHYLYQECNVSNYYSNITLYVNDGWNLLTKEDKIDFAARMMILYKGMLGARDLYKPQIKINFSIIDQNSNTLIAEGDTKSNKIAVYK